MKNDNLYLKCKQTSNYNKPIKLVAIGSCNTLLEYSLLSDSNSFIFDKQ